MVINVIISLKRGLIRELFSLLGIILGLALASRYYQEITFFDDLLKNPVLGRIIVFVLIFLAVAITAHIIGVLLQKLIKLGAMGLLDHMGGFIFGFLKGIIIIGIVLFLLSRFPPVTAMIEKSPIALAILRFISNIFHLIWTPEEVTEYI